MLYSKSKSEKNSKRESKREREGKRERKRERKREGKRERKRERNRKGKVGRVTGAQMFVLMGSIDIMRFYDCVNEYLYVTRDEM